MFLKLSKNFSINKMTMIFSYFLITVLAINRNVYYFFNHFKATSKRSRIIKFFCFTGFLILYEMVGPLNYESTYIYLVDKNPRTITLAY